MTHVWSCSVAISVYWWVLLAILCPLCTPHSNPAKSPFVLKKHVVFNYYLEILELKWMFISEKIIEINAGPATFWYITLNPD